MFHVRVVGIVLLAALVGGCGEKAPSRGIVRGRVTLDSKPVTGATVFFENPETGVGMNAQLSRDGQYEVKTHAGNGLPPGSYNVAVIPGGIMSPDEASPLAGEAKAARAKLPVVAVPEKYHKAASSGLKVEVKEGDNPPFDFSLTP